MPKRYLHGPMMWKVMQGNAWKDVANLRIKQLNNCTKSRRHAQMTAIYGRRKGSVGKLSTVCSQIVVRCLYLTSIGRPDILWRANKLARAVTKWTKACEKTFGAFDHLHSSHKWIQAILLCGQHSTTMQIGIVSSLWFWRRPWRLKINIRRIFVHFRTSHVCANKLDVQETDFSFTWFCRSRA